MKNKNQRAFINSIERVVEKANAAYGHVAQASKITPANPVACEQYLQSLQIFINACNRMTMELNVFFGEDSEVIGTREAGLNYRQPTRLN